MLTGTSITTARLVLVPLALADAAAIVNGHRPPGVNWAVGYPTEGSLVAAGLVVTAESEGRPLGTFGSYQVLRAFDSLVVGDAGFIGPPDGDGSVHVLCGICPVHRGHGYSSEALRALLAWASEQPGVERVLADTAHTNTDSIRVMQEAGMRRIGADERLVYYQSC